MPYGHLRHFREGVEIRGVFGPASTLSGPHPAEKGFWGIGQTSMKERP